jgi:hypothetical protein
MERDFLKGIFGVDRSGKYFHHIVALISIGIFGGGESISHGTSTHVTSVYHQLGAKTAGDPKRGQLS